MFLGVDNRKGRVIVEPDAETVKTVMAREEDRAKEVQAQNEAALAAFEAEEDARQTEEGEDFVPGAPPRPQIVPGPHFKWYRLSFDENDAPVVDPNPVTLSRSKVRKEVEVRELL